MNFKIFCVILLGFSYNQNNKMDDSLEKIKIGDCFSYNTKGNLSKFGFIVISKFQKKDKSIRNLQLAIVKISEKCFTLDDFKSGYLYTHKVQVGMENIKYILGLFCYNFDGNSLNILNKFNYLGNIKIDSSKYIVGTGSDASSEFMFGADLKNIDIITERYDKTKLIEIFAK